MTKNILIIGGAGFVGQAIAHELSKANNRILIPTRQKKGLDNLRTNPSVQIFESNAIQLVNLITILDNLFL